MKNYRIFDAIIFLVCTLFLMLQTSCGSGGGGGSNATNTPAAANPTPVALTSSKVSRIHINAPALEANLLGDVASRDITVYLPKAYYDSTASLPVIYYLPGFGDKDILGLNIPAGLDAAFTGLNPTIVVIVDGVNTFGGSFFVDSEITGKWATYVAHDVVNYIDQNYRTLAKRQSRGIAGHSMGGFGALNLAMQYANVFGSVFAISPGALTKDGLATTQMFDSAAHIKSMVNIVNQINNVSADTALSQLRQFASDPDVMFDLAYGLAFAPASTKPYFVYPYTLNGDVLIKDELVWAKWEAGFGNLTSKIIEYSASLQSLNGFGLDCGTNDEYQWIARGCDYLDKELIQTGIDHTYTVHAGKHQDQLPQRVSSFMLPFFSKHLANE